MAIQPKQKQEWQLLIGTFILTFGEIEQMLHLLWRRAFGGKQEPRDLSIRIGKLIGWIKGDDSLSQALPDLLVEVKKLAEYRNAVAHNGLSLQIIRHEETHKITPILRITSRTADTSITEDELRQLCKQAQHVALQIESAFWLREIAD